MTRKIKRLRRKIIGTLRLQGYELRGNQIVLPEDRSKHALRRMHEVAVAHKLDVAEPQLRKKEDLLLRFIANGSEVNPAQIRPRIVLVQPRTTEELLFRYAALHWSIPVSSGYGRRLRFLVFDEQNKKLIGLFGLGDPVFAMKARDSYVGWDSNEKNSRLYHVMDAYVLGAVPPYSHLLCGKLIALLALSNEVRRAFVARYKNSQTVIGKHVRPPYLALITTTSAFGRSSLYNRLRTNGTEYWKSVGFTQGSGEFHFSNGVYGAMHEFVKRECTPTAKQADWGAGFRNKREVVRKCLLELGFSQDLIYHGVKREVYVAPLGQHSLEFLQGRRRSPKFYHRPASALSQIFLQRWLLPRADRIPEYKLFRRESYRLWPKTAVERSSQC